MNASELSTEFASILSDWGFKTIEEQQQAINILEHSRNRFPVKNVSVAMGIDKDFGLNLIDVESAVAGGKTVEAILITDPHLKVVESNDGIDNLYVLSLGFQLTPTRGGARVGAGRPPKDPSGKKLQASWTLAPDVLSFIQSQPNQAEYLERLVRKDMASWFLS